MTEVHDLKDSRGRLQRLVLAFTVAVIAAGAAYGILYAVARPDDAAAAHAEGISVARHYRTAFQFVFYVSGAAFIIAFLATLEVANHLADKRYAKSIEGPEARITGSRK